MNPLNQSDIQRLKRAAEWSRRQQAPYRRFRTDALRQFLGFNYSDSAARDRVPINLVELATNIYMRQLAASNPHALISTHYRELRAFASQYEIAVNDAIVTMRLEDTLRMLVMNAMFSMGIVKTGVAEGSPVDVGDGQSRDVGRFFADNISLDDWVHDMTASSRNGWQFCGNRWTMRLDHAKDNPAFDADARAKLTADSRAPYDTDGAINASSLARGLNTSGEGEFHKRVELWDYWLPEERLIITVADNSDVPLAVVDHDGPMEGNYHILGFSDVPDATMPLAPVAIMQDLHLLANAMFRKLGRGADRQKTVLGVRAAGDDDGERIIHANDGDAIKMVDPKNAQEYKFGGVDPNSLAFLIQVKDLFSYFNGNLDALGGLSPQSKTLGQDELLTASASQRLAEMQSRTIAVTTDIMKAIAWDVWTDPVRRKMMSQSIPGTDISVPFEWTPETRKGEFMQYNFQIEPYSMAHATPAMKLQGIRNFLEGMIFPMLPMLQSQGKVLNIDSLVQTVARLGNLPEIDDIISDAGTPPMLQPQAQGDSQATLSPVTTRKYERVNRPGGTRSGQDNVMMRALLGSASQPEEAGAVGQGVG